MNIYQSAHHCLMLNDVAKKRTCVDALYKAWKNKEVTRDDYDLVSIETPGRPSKPELIDPLLLKRRKLGSETGRAMLIHAIAHIEFNAINLALDAVYRFRDMPDQYYSDWLKVASEEAYHFSLLDERLKSLGYNYGNFPAHNGLWEMVLKTDHDVMIRMALVPRVLEARGLDVTPGMMERLAKVGDHETVDILKVILRDEIGHVAIGSYWFKHCCESFKINPEQTFRDLLVEYMGGGIRGPFYMEGRLLAGFSQEEMDDLVAMMA
ncbi:MAG: ferritin-like domain-containing protein [Cocleimonas sp.]|nr:ferritin-like domain-containing protein [Cocleimonas sp.]